MGGRNKKTVLTIIGLVIIFSVAIFAMFYLSREVRIYNKENIIVKKDTALKIGRAILEEYYPDAFVNSDILLDAEENNGIWRVYNVVEREGRTEDGRTYIVLGGEIYVELRKKDGKILRVGLND